MGETESSNVQYEPGAVLTTPFLSPGRLRCVQSEGVIATRWAHLGEKVIQLSRWFPESVKTFSSGERFSVMDF